MANFLNSIRIDNEFTLMQKDNFYVDKTLLIAKMNSFLGFKERYKCITRPRRFGKTINAMMLATYYCKNLDARHIFDRYKIRDSRTYLEHLNKHNVIFMSFNRGDGTFKSYDEFIRFFRGGLIEDLKELLPTLDESKPISSIFEDVYDETNNKFIFIIDEWDAIFNNELYTEDDRKNFLRFLTDLLKDNAYVELAYMTGVLPIAKHSGKSTINMFLEYSAVNDNVFENYFGFTQEEVEKLCNKQEVEDGEKKIELKKLEEWYNGYYTHDGRKVYSPRSVICALINKHCDSYWTNTGPMEDIVDCIQGNVDKIRDDILKMLQGDSIKIKLSLFSTEKMEFKSREQILSAMTILGFLSYHKGALTIPNRELKMKFADSLKNKKFGKFAEIVRNSNEMLNATLDRDTETMAQLLREAHSIYTPVLKYNDENSLACVITIVYLSALDDYVVSREEKSGEGFADFIFYPENKSDTSFIIELKVNKSADVAVQQIKDRNYLQRLKNYTGEKLAIGIAYNSKTKEHEIKIEELS